MYLDLLVRRGGRDLNEALSWHLPVWTNGNHTHTKTFSTDTGYLGTNSKGILPE
jgi:hypothetical protein